MTIRTLSILALGSALAALPLSGALAQSGNKPAAGNQNCHAMPKDKANPGNNAPAGRDGTTRDNGAGNDNSLSEKLNDCGGVLQPPATGDTGVVKPPEPKDKMPVFKPGQVPQQGQQKD